MNDSELYPSSVAREKLGNISTSELKRLVDRGELHRVIPRGFTSRKSFFYKSEIDALAQAWEEFKKFTIVA